MSLGNRFGAVLDPPSLSSRSGHGTLHSRGDCSGAFIHADVRFQFGPLRFLLVTPVCNGVSIAAKGALAELLRLLRFDKFLHGFGCRIPLFKLPLQEVQG